jgi:ABC-type transport system substrate-binding protein
LQLQQSGVRQVDRRRAANPRQQKRIALLQQAGKILMDDAPYVPLYNLATIYGAAKNLQWKMRPDEKVLGWDMKIT